MVEQDSFKRSRRIGKKVKANKREQKKKASEQVPKRFRRGHRGIVRDVQIREVEEKKFRLKKRQEDYLSFLLEVTDSEGNIVELIPIEMRDENIPGRVIRNGDPVIVKGKRTRKGLVKPNAIYMVNSHLIIDNKKGGPWSFGWVSNFIMMVLTFSITIASALAWPAILVGGIALAAGGAELGVGLIALGLITLFLFYVIDLRS